MKVKIIRESIKRDKLTNQIYFMLELNKILNTQSNLILHKGKNLSFKYEVKDMIKYLISHPQEILKYYKSSPKNLILLMYPDKNNLKKILKTHQHFQNP